MGLPITGALEVLNTPSALGAARLKALRPEKWIMLFELFWNPLWPFLMCSKDAEKYAHWQQKTTQ